MSDAVGRAAEILVVDDNPGDVRLMREAFRGSKIQNTLHAVDSGEEALSFLLRQGPHTDKEPPDLILLDLNLPGISGQEVLETLKADPELRKIPVVVLTTSAHDEDILRSYRLHANCFVTKPVDFDKFVNVVLTLQEFWLTVVKLPRA